MRMNPGNSPASETPSAEERGQARGWVKAVLAALAFILLPAFAALVGVQGQALVEEPTGVGGAVPTSANGLGMEPAQREATGAASEFTQAEAFLNAAEWDEARVLLETLAARTPQDAQATYLLALLRASADPAGAVGLLLQAAQMSPEYADSASQLALTIHSGLEVDDPAYLLGLVGLGLLEREQPALAARALEGALSLNPDYAEAHSYLGLALEMRGEDGLAHLQRAVELQPDSALVHLLLGRSLRQAGSNRRAVPELQAAFELDPANPAITAELGGAYAALEEYETAEAWFQAAAALAPEEVGFWLLLGEFYADHEIELGAGLNAALRAVAAEPDSAPANDLLGYLMYLTGNSSGAETQYLKALAADPEHASVRYHLGLLRASQNRMSEALAEFELARQYDPGGKVGSLAESVLKSLQSR